jgi:5-methylcytosine-specific restriction protein A
MRQPENMLCRMCATNGYVRLAKQVDHIIPFVGLHDPLRLDKNNLQPLCVACHDRKTANR